MIVEVLAIGTEVVLGETINTNASWLSSQMTHHGFQVKFHTSIPDEESLILEALQLASRRSKIVLVTGGLGPTVDDMTLDVAAKFFKRERVIHSESLEKIRHIFQHLKKTMTPNQERQARLIKGGTPLSNSVGTAPGLHLLENEVHFAFLPGVPSEMQEMFRKELLPIFKKIQPEKFQVIRSLCCFGPPEGQIDTVLQELMNQRREIAGAEVGLKIRFPNIDIRLKTSHSNPQEAQRIVDHAAQLILEKLPDCIFGGGEDTLQEVLSRLLIEKNKTIATAESCTGGLLANWITNVPGASQYFLAGVVSYSNTAKVEMLEVSEKTLEEKGAVSAETALEMARGVQKKTGADLSISITGIAGPTGGNDQKPVGTVFIAVVHSKEEWVKEFHFPLGRLRFKQLAAATALDRVRKILLKML